MTRTISPITLGYGILAGPIMWAVHFVLVYMVAEFGCRANFVNLTYFSPDGIRTFIFGVTVVFVLGVASGGIIAYRSWNTLQNNGEGDSPRNERTQFLVKMGLFLSALFILSIIFTAMPAFFTNACDRAL
jgi:hypothetical protein